MTDIYQIAEQSLRANIVKLPSGQYLTAGQNQFQTLWTRDFCHAVKGLVAIGESEVAKNHLTYLLNNLREDGLAPRVVDNYQVQFRVAFQTFRKFIPALPRLSFKEPLRAQYIDEHGSNAFDSNLLVLLAAIEMGPEFWKKNEASLKRVWHWYDDKFRDGLIYQSSFSDWQDTTKREGHSLLLNLFYYMVSTCCHFTPAVPPPALKQKIKETFYNGTVFLSMDKYEQVSVEGNLFLLLDPTFLNASEKDHLWKNLKDHPIISTDSVIGRCSFPDWPANELAWHIKFANLSRYHGSLSWSWLMGLGLEVCIEMKDEEMIKKQYSHIESILKRDREVSEVYDPERLFNPWGSWLLRAEHPFAWGAGYLVHSLKKIKA